MAWRNSAYRGLVVFASLLAGCMQLPDLPDFERTPHPSTWYANKPQQVDLTDRLHKDVEEQDLRQWWQQWQDPILNQLLDITLVNNPSLESVGITHQIALVQAGVSTAQFRPKGNVGLGASHSESKSSSITGYNLTGNVSWELDLWGTRQAQKDKALAAVERTQLELHAAQVSLVAQVVQSYVALRSAQEHRSLAESAQQLRLENYQLAQWQKQAGIATELQEAQALTLLRQAEAQIPSHEKTELQALQQLQAFAGGQQDDEFFSVLMALKQRQALPIPQRSRLVVAADALRQRPDVRAQEQAIYEQTANTILARHARYPSFSLSGSLGANDEQFSNLFDINHWVSRLGANLSLLLFDGGVLRRAEEVQKLQLEKSLLSYRDTLLQAQQEAENALTALAAAQRQQASFQQALDAAQLTVDLATMQYDAGLLDFAELLNTQTALLNSQSSALNNQQDILNSWVLLYRSLGGGIQTSVAVIEGEIRE